MTIRETLVAGLLLIFFGQVALSCEDTRQTSLFGLTFQAEYKSGIPYSGAVAHQGAADYFWVDHYVNGQPTTRRHYMVRNGKPAFFLITNAPGAAD